MAKIECSYCGSKNSKESCNCSQCGAPLENNIIYDDKTSTFSSTKTLGNSVWGIPKSERHKSFKRFFDNSDFSFYIGSVIMIAAIFILICMFILS